MQYNWLNPGNKNKIKVLIIGGGGREHTLAWKVAQSPRLEKLYVAPGNAGTAQFATNVPIEANDLPALLAFAQANKINLTIVGPEDPLSEGIVDLFQSADLPVFGPTRKAAQLESSKAFSKAFMERHGIPTAAYRAFTDATAALAYLDTLPTGGIVVKASGLAAGKGVIVCDSLEQAKDAVKTLMLDRQFGSAGDTLIIEQRLEGVELSLLAFCDGYTAVPMVPARDHKRVFDGDEGPNTGGMGAFAPVPDLSAEQIAELTRTVLQKTVDGLRAEGILYVGVLYAGLMLSADGVYTLEFNCRFGDPETQVILPMLESDLIELIRLCIIHKLTPQAVKIRAGAAATVVMASHGYPGAYPKAIPIAGVALANSLENVMVFHAGTTWRDGHLLTNGGRVLAVSAIGRDLDDALNKAYAGVCLINFEGAHYRTDIGKHQKNWTEF